MFRIFLIVAGLCSLMAQAADRMNFIIVLADDLGINDLGVYGRAEHRTPNLDRLAGEGIRFNTAYCAQPICSPSRAALLTGKSPARLHLTTFLPGRGDNSAQRLLHPKIRQELPLEEKTLAEYLREAGYATACVGKWHLGGKGFEPQDQGFTFVHTGQADTKPSGEEGGKGEHDLTQQAVKFLEANRQQPFLLYVAHNNPHVPLAARKELIAKNQKAFNPVYAAMVETLDEQTGVLLKAVDRLGLAKNTVVILASDNGGLHVRVGANTPATRNDPFRGGKGYLYEGGLRVPLLVRWPGMSQPGRVEETPVVLGDLMPTLLEAAGGAIPAGLDYASLLPLLRDPAQFAKRPLFWHFPHYTNQGGRPGGAVRVGDWKMIENYEDGRLELYNLASDRGETNNLAFTQSGRVAEMRGQLEAYRRATGAQENTINPDYSPALGHQVYELKDTSLPVAAASFKEAANSLADWRKAMDAKPANGGDLGFIRLHAREAKPHGEKLQYELPPHKDTLGYWVNPADYATWEFEVKYPGTYTVQVLQGCGKGSGGATVELSAGDARVSFTVQETGNFQHFVPREIGTLALGAGKQTLTLRALKKPGAAVMDLREINLLRATP